MVTMKQFDQLDERAKHTISFYSELTRAGYEQNELEYAYVMYYGPDRLKEDLEHVRAELERVRNEEEEEEGEQ